MWLMGFIDRIDRAWALISFICLKLLSIHITSGLWTVHGGDRLIFVGLEKSTCIISSKIGLLHHLRIDLSLLGNFLILSSLLLFHFGNLSLSFRSLVIFHIKEVLLQHIVHILVTLYFLNAFQLLSILPCKILMFCLTLSSLLLHFESFAFAFFPKTCFFKLCFLSFKAIKLLLL